MSDGIVFAWSIMFITKSDLLCLTVQVDGAHSSASELDKPRLSLLCGEENQTRKLYFLHTHTHIYKVYLNIYGERETEREASQVYSGHILALESHTAVDLHPKMKILRRPGDPNVTLNQNVVF